MEIQLILVTQVINGNTTVKKNSDATISVYSINIINNM